MTSPSSADPPHLDLLQSPRIEDARPICVHGRAWREARGMSRASFVEPCALWGILLGPNGGHMSQRQRRHHRQHHTGARAHPGEARDEVVPNSKPWSSRWLIHPKYQMLTNSAQSSRWYGTGSGSRRNVGRLSIEPTSCNHSSHSSLFLTPRSAENRPRPMTGRRVQKPLWRTRQGRWSATEPPRAWPSPPARPPPARPGLRMRKRPCYRRIRCARGDARALFRRTRR